MLKNYFITAIRNLKRHKDCFSINIFGFAFSLTLSLLVLGFVLHEYSYDNFHTHKGRIAQIFSSYDYEETGLTYAYGMRPMAVTAVEEVPEVEKAVIFKYRYEKIRTEEFFDRDLFSGQDCVIYSDEEFLNVFTFPLQAGKVSDLNEPFKVFITEKASRKYFGSQNPMGQLVRFDGDNEYVVSGILKDIPHNSHLGFEFIASYKSLTLNGEPEYTWSDYHEKDRFGDDYVYLLLNDNHNLGVVEDKILQIINKNLEKEIAEGYTIQLMPLKEIYHGVSTFKKLRGQICHCDFNLIYTSSLIAFLILVLSIVNFVNIATARTVHRSKEVAVRKVVGASKKQLFWQFIVESFVTILCATGISILLYTIITPLLSSLYSGIIFTNFFGNMGMVISVFVLVILVSAFAGFYPSLYLVQFNPTSIFRSKLKFTTSNSIIRKILVVVQFSIVFLFISYTLILKNQTAYLTSMDLGFRKNNILVLGLKGKEAAKYCSILKNEIMKISVAESVTAVDHVPGVSAGYDIYYTDLSRRRETRILGTGFSVDKDFFSTFGLKLIRGKSFKDAHISGNTNKILVNESFVEMMNIAEPVGCRIFSEEQMYEIIGVFKDFYGAPMSLHHRFPLYIITMDPDLYKYLCITLPHTNIPSAIITIQQVWNKIIPDQQFNYSFLNKNIESRYTSINNRVLLLSLLSGIAMCIATLGVFGLISFMTEQRTKEIGIRKILGSSIFNIIKLLAFDFLKLLGISCLIGMPLSYIFGNCFVSIYAVQAPIRWWIFVYSAGAVIICTCIAIGYRTVTAALANPVDSLRYE